MYPVLKRVLDFTVSLTACLLTLPLLLGITVCIRLTTGSPVLFRQRRPGQQGKPFYMLKFRTMRNLHPGEAAAETDAVRITALGRFLRSSSLDELPTLLNVLRGDISLVGPRPLLMQYLDRYTPAQARRHEVRPGITGWAQINGRNAISWEQKFKLDVWYVDHRSFVLDLKILFLTASKVLKREGISHAGEATMAEFMGTKKGEK
ncbi:MAG: sugar transferase [Deltaproteobacteria bacterium]|nr:sugar transferase [Deltaproteobacteria bacterium]